MWNSEFASTPLEFEWFVANRLFLQYISIYVFLGFLIFVVLTSSFSQHKNPGRQLNLFVLFRHLRGEKMLCFLMFCSLRRWLRCQRGKICCCWSPYERHVRGVSHTRQSLGSRHLILTAALLLLLLSRQIIVIHFSVWCVWVHVVHHWLSVRVFDSGGGLCCCRCCCWKIFVSTTGMLLICNQYETRSRSWKKCFLCQEKKI